MGTLFSSILPIVIQIAIGIGFLTGVKRSDKTTHFSRQVSFWVGILLLFIAFIQIVVMAFIVATSTT